MNKEEAAEVIAQFEAANPDELVTRKQMIEAMTAMNVYTMYMITEEISNAVLDSMIKK